LLFHGDCVDRALHSAFTATAANVGVVQLGDFSPSPRLEGEKLEVTGSNAPSTA
jgi:hypothetical protein